MAQGGTMKKVLLVILAIVIILFIAFGVTVFKMNEQLNQIDKTPIDISMVEDGVYEGQSETPLVKVTVRVSVSNGTITNVELLRHECGKGSIANGIVDVIKEKNDIEVDAVSGATFSSEVIKDAVRQALRNKK